jgi:hypothetical protein
VAKSDTSRHYNDILAILKHHGFTFNSMLVKDCLQALTQTLMDIEVSQMLDASRYERNTTRRAYRNGYRSTVWNTSIGNIDLRIPKLRRGTYYPDRLLNDSYVSKMLIHLIRMCILQGIDEDYVAGTVSALKLITLSSYEIQQLCDGIRLHLELSDSATDSVNDKSVLTDRLLISDYRYGLLSRKRRVHVEETLQLDSEFWQDFMRRLVQAGLVVESDQAMLSGNNPYASLRLDENHSILCLDFAQYIYSPYEEDYQWIA